MVTESFRLYLATFTYKNVLVDIMHRNKAI